MLCVHWFYAQTNFMTHCLIIQNETRSWLSACQMSTISNVISNGSSHEQGYQSVVTAVTQLCNMTPDQWKRHFRGDYYFEQSVFRDLAMGLRDDDDTVASRAQVTVIVAIILVDYIVTMIVMWHYRN